MGKCCNLPFYWFLQAQKSLELDVSIALWLCDNECRGTVWVLGSLLPQAQPLMSFSHISSLQPNKFRFEGWKSLNGSFYHPEQVVPCCSPRSLVLQPRATRLLSLPLRITQRSQAHSASRQSFSNLFVIFPPALFMKAACRNALPLIATPFLSVLFPAGYFTLTHQIDMKQEVGNIWPWLQSIGKNRSS